MKVVNDRSTCSVSKPVVYYLPAMADSRTSGSPSLNAPCIRWHSEAVRSASVLLRSAYRGKPRRRPVSSCRKSEEPDPARNYLHQSFLICTNTEIQKHPEAPESLIDKAELTSTCCAAIRHHYVRLGRHSKPEPTP